MWRICSLIISWFGFYRHYWWQWLCNVIIPIYHHCQRQVFCLIFKNYCLVLVMSVMLHTHTVRWKIRDFLKYFLDFFFFLIISVICIQRSNVAFPLMALALLYSTQLCSTLLALFVHFHWEVPGTCYSVLLFWCLLQQGSKESSPVLSHTHCWHYLVQIIVIVSLHHQQ